MANEAVIIEYPSNIVMRTCADGNAITKGAILKLSDPNTVAVSDGANVFGGIAMADKVASDGSTTIPVALNGVFDIVDAGTGITVGGLVALSGANLVRQSVEADFPLGAVLGKAEETASASERIRVRVGLVG